MTSDTGKWSSTNSPTILINTQGTTVSSTKSRFSYYYLSEKFSLPFICEVTVNPINNKNNDISISFDDMSTSHTIWINHNINKEWAGLGMSSVYTGALNCGDVCKFLVKKSSVDIYVNNEYIATSTGYSSDNNRYVKLIVSNSRTYTLQDVKVKPYSE